MWQKLLVSVNRGQVVVCANCNTVDGRGVHRITGDAASRDRFKARNVEALMKQVLQFIHSPPSHDAGAKSFAIAGGFTMRNDEMLQALSSLEFGFGVTVARQGANSCGFLLVCFMLFLPSFSLKANEPYFLSS